MYYIYDENLTGCQIWRRVLVVVFFHLKYLSKSHNSELSRLKAQVVLVQVQSSKKHLTATQTISSLVLSMS